jgi:hypothetical protein
MTPKENLNENLRKSISGIFGKKFMGTHCNALILLYIVILSYTLLYIYDFIDCNLIREGCLKTTFPYFVIFCCNFVVNCYKI